MNVLEEVIKTSKPSISIDVIHEHEAIRDKFLGIKQNLINEGKLDLISRIMEINELYLKTAFCCMACDGDIAPKELEFIRSYVSNNELFSVVDVENKLNEYVADINQQGISFLNDYLKDIANMSLTETQELNIVRIAIQ